MAIKDRVLADRETIFQQLSELVSFNSVYVPPAAGGNPVAVETSQWVRSAFAEVGVELEPIETSDGSLTLVGRKAVRADAPTVLLYSHYDVVLAGDPERWDSDPFTLTERTAPDGSTRWYGRGAADCKGNLIMHLAALRAIAAEGNELPVNLLVVIEGSEESGGGGLDTLIEERPELFTSDVILIADSGNAEVGSPALTASLRGGAQLTVTVNTLATPVHSGQFGGAAPDAVAALIRMLDSLRDASGRVVIDGVDTTQRWPGASYPRETFRADSTMLEGTEITAGEDDDPADLVWARPAVTVIGFSSTPVDQAVNAVPATASARLNLRVPAGMPAGPAAEKLAAHLRAHAPWGAHVDIEIEGVNEGFATDVDKPAAQALAAALAEAYETDKVEYIGSGGSIPLTVALQTILPEAEIALFGVEEPLCAIHSPNESVDPTEIERIAIAEALFLTRFGK